MAPYIDPLLPDTQFEKGMGDGNNQYGSYLSQHPTSHSHHSSCVPTVSPEDNISTLQNQDKVTIYIRQYERELDEWDRENILDNAQTPPSWIFVIPFFALFVVIIVCIFWFTLL